MTLFNRVLLFLTLGMALPGLANAQFEYETTPLTWEGLIEGKIEQFGEGWPTDGAGCVPPDTLTFKYNVRWKEIEGLFVLDDDTGELVGELVSLVDDGSTWEATLSGKAAWSYIGTNIPCAERCYRDPNLRPSYCAEICHEQECQVTDTWSGSDSGDGPDPFGRSVIYYSLSDNDPLEDVLPDGYYFWLAGHSSHEGTWLRQDTCKRQPESRGHSMTVGQVDVSMAPLIIPVGPATVREAKATGYIKENLGFIQGNFDTVKRVLTTDGMTGDYVHLNRCRRLSLNWDIQLKSCFPIPGGKTRPLHCGQKN